MNDCSNLRLNITFAPSACGIMLLLVTMNAAASGTRSSQPRGCSNWSLIHPTGLDNIARVD